MAREDRNIGLTARLRGWAHEIKTDVEAIRNFNGLVASAQSGDPARSAEFDASLSSASSASSVTWRPSRCGSRCW